MRPINKGEAPKKYKKYGEAKIDLIEKIGAYCSYCEMNIDNQADIEHVSPKSKDPELELEWSNFLLSCKTCNTIKNDKEIDRKKVLFPDECNTAALYSYEDGKVEISDNLSDKEKELAKNLFEIIKLDRKVQSNLLLDDRDRSRRRTFEKAKQALEEYKEAPIEQMSNLIGRSPEGFFSVWLEVFKEYPKVKKKILENVPGTAIECYDKNLNAKRTIKR